MSFIFPKYIFTCKEAIHNNDNTVTYHNVFESIEAPFFPFPLDFNLIIGLEYSIPKKGNRKIFISITDPDDEKISANDFLIELRPTIKNQQRFALNVIDVEQFTIEKKGMYSVSVFHNNEILTRHDFMVVEGGIVNDSINND